MAGLVHILQGISTARPDVPIVCEGPLPRLIARGVFDLRLAAPSGDDVVRRQRGRARWIRLMGAVLLAGLGVILCAAAFPLLHTPSGRLGPGFLLLAVACSYSFYAALLFHRAIRRPRLAVQARLAAPAG